MVSIIRSPQESFGYVSVILGCSDVVVAEKCLDVFNFGAVLKQVGGKCMS